MEQITSALNRAANSNAVLNTLLAGVLGVLGMKSVAQQRSVEALEAEKAFLFETNKVIKKTLWDWKQLLYAEAEADPQKALVPLSTLKAIYGEVTPSSPAVSGSLLCLLIVSSWAATGSRIRYRQWQCAVIAGDDNQGGKAIMI